MGGGHRRLWTSATPKEMCMRCDKRFEETMEIFQEGDHSTSCRFTGLTTFVARRFALWTLVEKVLGSSPGSSLDVRGYAPKCLSLRDCLA